MSVAAGHTDYRCRHPVNCLFLLRNGSEINLLEEAINCKTIGVGQMWNLKKADLKL
jgi:hypothetical protein